MLTHHLEGKTVARVALEVLFANRLYFGTAGIRGPIRPGPAGTNRVVIGKTTASVARYLLSAADDSVPMDIGIVVAVTLEPNMKLVPETSQKFFLALA